MRLCVRGARASSFPSYGCEFTDTLGGPTSQAGQHVIEVFPNINSVSLAGLDDGHDGRYFWSCHFGPNVQPIPSAEGNGTHPILAPIIICLQDSVLQECLQPLPLVQGVSYPSGEPIYLSRIDSVG